LKDDYVITREKFKAIEPSIPIMVKEMVKFYIDQKFENRLEAFITR